MPELRHFVKTATHWWWLILLSAGIAAAASFYAMQSMPKMYRASATVMIGQILEQKNPDLGSMTVIDRLAQSYSEMARRRPVLEGTIDQLGLPTSPGALSTQITTRLVFNTPLLEIQVVDPDPKQAALIANEVARQLVLQSPAVKREEKNDQLDDQTSFIQSQLRELKSKIEEGQATVSELQRSISARSSASEITDARNQLNVLQTQIAGWQSTYGTLLGLLQPSTTNYLAVIEPASIPSQPTIGNLAYSVGLAAGVGLLLALVVSLLLEYLDDSIRRPEDVEAIPGIKTMGFLSRFPRRTRNGKASELAAASSPLSRIAEDFRALRISLQHAGLSNPGMSVLVTSVSDKTACSTTTANLAATYAQMGKRVILVDADLRRPRLHQIFEVQPRTTLPDLLRDGTAAIEPALVRPKDFDLLLLPSRPSIENPSDLLGSPRMEELIRRLSGMADILLLNGAPLSQGTDIKALSPKVGGVMIVIAVGKDRAATLRRVTGELEHLGANLLGVVLSKGQSRRTTVKNRRRLEPVASPQNQPTF